MDSGNSGSLQSLSGGFLVMDSGNSGSLQSLSGGGGGDDDQEYDDSISRPASSMIYNSISLQQSMINPGFASYSNYYNSSSVASRSSMFNSPLEYVNIFSQSSLNQNQNSLMNHDVTLSRDLQLDQPNYTTLIDQNPLGSSSPMSQNSQSISFIASQTQTQPQGPTILRPNHENGSRIMKKSKKRTRASRRAPTTVLTTDTSNFRAMVQEFTGIPAPPFSTASSSFSRQFDLFGSGTSSLFPIRPNNNISRPLGSLNASATSTTTNNTNLNNSNYEHIPHRDPMLTFRSLLQPNSSSSNQIKYSETPGFGTKAVQGRSTIMTTQNGEQSIRNGNINQTQEKGSEIMLNHGSSRGGDQLGTIDSWICQSD